MLLIGFMNLTLNFTLLTLSVMIFFYMPILCVTILSLTNKFFGFSSFLKNKVRAKKTLIFSIKVTAVTSVFCIFPSFLSSVLPFFFLTPTKISR